MRNPTRKTAWAQALALALAASLVASPALARSRKGHGRHHGHHRGHEWHHGDEWHPGHGPHHGRGRLQDYAGGEHLGYVHPVGRHHRHHDDDLDDVFLALGLGAVGLTALALFAQPPSAYGPYGDTAPAAAAPPIDWSRIDAGVTVVDEGYAGSGEFCREFQQEIVVGGREERGYGIACLQEDGSWRIGR
jgi:hypothetical protein